MATNLRNATPQDIEQELRRYDRLGHLGYAQSVGANPASEHKYHIVHGGRSYPSKLIVAGVTHRNPSAFSGGVSHLGLALIRKGFLFQQLAFSFLARIAATAAVVLAPTSVGATGDVEAYFASGSNRAADIHGFTYVGHSVMTVADKTSCATETALYDVARQNASRRRQGLPLLQVGIDSGAFSEVEFNAPHKCSKLCHRKACIGAGNLPYPKAPPFTFVTVKPMGDKQWQNVMDLYARLALVFAEYGVADSLHVIAPDKIADQTVTLTRLVRYRTEVRSLAEQGVHVLVVAQKGAQTQVEFARSVLTIIGDDLDWTWALPCKKGATSINEACTFAEAIRPERCHLLGLGTGNRFFDDFVLAFQVASPATILTCDSCWLAANAGHARNGSKARPLTAARVIAAQLIRLGHVHTRVVHELAIVLALTHGVYQAPLFC